MPQCLPPAPRPTPTCFPAARRACRLRAQAVCPTWRAALAGLPVRSLELYAAAGEDKWQWAIQTRPEVEEVQIHADPYNLAPALLHSVAHKVTGSLRGRAGRPARPACLLDDWLCANAWATCVPARL